MNTSFFLPQIDKERCLSWCVDTSPCQAACPLGIDVEGYLSAIASGDFEDAIAIIREQCALPSVCGRVCHHPCETECKRGLVDEPISIRALKRFAADACSSHTQRAEPVEQTRPEKIAIIGSGPAGLAAAHDLVRRGFAVTVFERMAVPGGMLAFGIPEFNLPQEIVQGEIDYIRSLGVEIRTGVGVGTDITLRELRDHGYRAILIATGAQDSALLTMPGSDLEGIIPAMPFLQKAKLGDRESISGRVAVIGGGNVAIDVARTARRLGAEEVRIVCLESRDDMPAFGEMIEAAEREGVLMETGLAPESFQSVDGKRVSRIILRWVTSFSRNVDGQIRFQVDKDPQGVVERDVDWVIIAIGQILDSVTLDLSPECTPMGTFDCDPLTGMTKSTGIFGAGDVVDNPGTVTGSMAGGRRAADTIARFLSGEVSEQRGGTGGPFTGSDSIPQGITPSPRRQMAMLPAEEGVKNFQEVELGFTRDEAMEEAARCLRCKTCNRCAVETRCVALSLTSNGRKMSPCVQGMVCAGCGRCARACPFAAIYLVEFE